MKISDDIKNAAKASVLCWLATVDDSLIPNVSPKEIFTVIEDKLVIANIISPVSEQNIISNPNVCVSFVDVLVQKGYKVKGTARIIDESSIDFANHIQHLEEMTNGKFPIKNIIEISPSTVSEIVAPSYIFFPETTVDDQISAANVQYGLLE